MSNLWTREEMILALNLYLKLPFGKMHSSNAEIKHLAQLINRTPDAVAMRLSNYAHLDPYHQNRGIIGLANGATRCKPIWNEFINNKEELIFESEKLLAIKENKTIEEKYPEISRDISNLKGEEKIRQVKTRVNQNVFRQIILAGNEYKCLITKINIQELLVASHIVPWSKNKDARLDPENGLCLNALYDKAFDKGLFTISNDFKVILSKKLKSYITQSFYQTFFHHLDDFEISFSGKYKPKKEFLEYHRDEIFDKPPLSEL
jgi:putative restriction endonuclease